MGDSKDHALLSPSSAKRWITCTPSARFEEQFPNEETEFAKEGTLAHSISELILKKRLGLIGQYEEHLDECRADPLYSEEMLTHCEQYADFCLEGLQPGDVCAVETLLDLGAYAPESFGTGDFMRVALQQRKLYFKDLKYGKGVPVSAVDNDQLKTYALGALQWFGWLYDIESVEVSIYQPRINNITSWEISVKDLLAWGETVLKPQALKAFNGEGEYKVGDHCKFCRARVRCQALADYNLDLFRHNLKPSNELPDAAILEILQKVPILTSWAEDIAAYALAEAVKGKKWEGMKLVEGKSNRVFVSEGKTEKKLLDAGIKEDKIYTPKKLLGITALSENIGAKAFRELVEPDLRKPPGTPTLVPVSDPRKDFDHAVSVFKDAEIREELK